MKKTMWSSVFFKQLQVEVSYHKKYRETIRSCVYSTIKFDLQIKGFLFCSLLFIYFLDYSLFILFKEKSWHQHHTQKNNLKEGNP